MGVRRRRPAPKGLRVERAYAERNDGERPAYWEIALRLYERTGSCHRVAAELESALGVRVGAKTASGWINRGIYERQAANAHPREGGVEEDRDPAEARP